jgi:RNA ligase
MLNFSEVERLISDGYISCQQHPTLPLIIYNYTHKAQFDRMWTPETKACRGLIVDDDYNIVGRSFPKFFNYGETDDPIPDGSFEVYEKMDGSLIIVTMYLDQLIVATRGSFTSEQADHARLLLATKYLAVDFRPGYTYCFEVVFPSNRIVLDYGDRDELILLAIIETKTGVELPLPHNGDWGTPVVERYDGVADFRTLTLFDRANKEGYVIKWANSHRLKMKFEEYKRLHRIITGMNTKTIWEYLRDGKSLDELITKVPDAFYSWVRKTSGELLDAYNELDLAYSAIYTIIIGIAPKAATRKEIAGHFIKEKHPGILFAMLDNRDYAPLIWRLLKPKAEKPFKENMESE